MSGYAPPDPERYECIGTCPDSDRVEYDHDPAGLRIIRMGGQVFRMIAAVAEAIRNAPPSPFSRIPGLPASRPTR